MVNILNQNREDQILTAINHPSSKVNLNIADAPPVKTDLASPETLPHFTIGTEDSENEKVRARLELSKKNLNNIFNDYVRVNAYHERTSYKDIEKLDRSIDHLLNGVYSVLKVVTHLNQLPVCCSSEEFRDSLSEVRALGRKVHTLVNELARRSPNTQKATPTKDVQPLTSNFLRRVQVTIIQAKSSVPDQEEPPENEKKSTQEAIKSCQTTLDGIYRLWFYSNNLYQGISYSRLNLNPDVSYFDRGSLLREKEVQQLDDSIAHLLGETRKVKIALSDLKKTPICHESKKLYKSIRIIWMRCLSVQRNIEWMAELSPNTKPKAIETKRLLGNFRKFDWDPNDPIFKDVPLEKRAGWVSYKF